VSDVDSHRRPLVGSFDPLVVPPLIIQGALIQPKPPTCAFRMPPL
jgi:hypothetical protein